MTEPRPVPMIAYWPAGPGGPDAALAGKMAPPWRGRGDGRVALDEVPEELAWAVWNVAGGRAGWLSVFPIMERRWPVLCESVTFGPEVGNDKCTVTLFLLGPDEESTT